MGMPETATDEDDPDVKIPAAVAVLEAAVELLELTPARIEVAVPVDDVPLWIELVELGVADEDDPDVEAPVDAKLLGVAADEGDPDTKVPATVAVLEAATELLEITLAGVEVAVAVDDVLLWIELVELIMAAVDDVLLRVELVELGAADEDIAATVSFWYTLMLLKAQ